MEMPSNLHQGSWTGLGKGLPGGWGSCLLSRWGSAGSSLLGRREDYVYGNMVLLLVFERLKEGGTNAGEWAGILPQNHLIGASARGFWLPQDGVQKGSGPPHEAGLESTGDFPTPLFSFWR